MFVLLAAQLLWGVGTLGNVYSAKKFKGTTPFKTMHFNFQQNICAYPDIRVLEYFNR